MHPNGKWFHERALLEADIIWQLVAEVGGMHIVPDHCPTYMALKSKGLVSPCKVAVDRRGCAELHARAQVVNLELNQLRCLLSLCHSVTSLLPPSCNSRSLHRVLLAL